MTILVPRGAEEQAVRRAAPGGLIAAIAAGAASADLPEMVVPGRLAIVLGLCGSLGGATVGDVVVYSGIAGNGAAGVDAFEAGEIAHVRALLPQARPVVGVTADRVVTTSAARASLAARSGAGVVDMEAAHLTRALRARGVRFAMVRVVSDDPSGAIRPLALARAFARAPLAAVRFVRDVQASLRVLSSIGATLAAEK